MFHIVIKIFLSLVLSITLIGLWSRGQIGWDNRLLRRFTPVYAQGDPGNGIAGYDLKSVADRAFAFDYDGSGKLDHLALYRPGTGTIWILRNEHR